MKQTQNYCAILKEELVPALGCTEPIAIAYASALAIKHLGKKAEHMLLECSGNIIKNVKGVVVPNTGGLKGVKAAAIAGAIAGDSDLYLEVIAHVSDEQIEEIKALEKTDFCEVKCMYQEANLNIIAHVYAGHNEVKVQIMHTHTNVVLITYNEEIIYQKDCNSNDFNSALIDRSCLNVKDIYEFAVHDSLDGVKELLREQVSYNLKIADEGLTNDYGARVGKVLRQMNQDLYTTCISYAAAASDARMSGCKMAVMTCSGSGNQGVTASLPIIIYAREKHIEEEKLLRALALSDLLTVRIKTGIGRLSAYCGVVCAATGSFAGIAYLEGYGLDVISKMIVNNLGTISGMVCDGAKQSCASKISTALFSALLGYRMAVEEISFDADTGIIQKELEETIDTVGQLGRDGMKETDKVILQIMTEHS